MAIQRVSPTIIGKALGHHSQAATAMYARLTQDPLRQAMMTAQAPLANPKKLDMKRDEIVVQRQLEIRSDAWSVDNHGRCHTINLQKARAICPGFLMASNKIK